MVVHERSSSAAPTPVVVRKAWRCFDGCFDGDSEDSDDEYAADDAKRARNNSSARSKPIYATNVRLLPRAGGSRSITVVATADLHRHHADKYIDGNSKSLAEYFESALARGRANRSRWQTWRGNESKNTMHQRGGGMAGRRRTTRWTRWPQLRRAAAADRPLAPAGGARGSAGRRAARPPPSRRPRPWRWSASRRRSGAVGHPLVLSRVGGGGGGGPSPSPDRPIERGYSCRVCLAALAL